MAKCFICKRKVPIALDTKETFSPNKTCLRCFTRMLVECVDMTDRKEFDAWKKKVREEKNISLILGYEVFKKKKEREE